MRNRLIQWIKGIVREVIDQEYMDSPTVFHRPATRPLNETEKYQLEQLEALRGKKPT